MFTLVIDKSKYLRVKQGQSGAEIEKVFSFPVGEVFAGEIIEMREPLKVYIARPAETYKSIASGAGLSEEELREINANKPVYPFCKIYIPCKK